MKNAHVFSQSDARNVFMFMITDRYGLMLLWFTDLMNVTEEVTIHLGLWIVTSSVTFIKSVNQSSIKPYLIVHLVAVWT